MLTREENDLLTQTGPGTPMGELMRRSWFPALLSNELPEPDGEPKQIKLLGERLVAFRDSEGKIGLMAEGCPHRGASLAYGRNEGCGLRCLYHGWKVDVTGRLMETPTEGPASTLKDRLRHVAYATHEVAGVVFAYMGPPEHQPPFAEWEWTRASEDQLEIGKVFEDCNYAQGLEGSIDSAHSDYLHSSELGDRPKDHAPRLDAQDTAYGFRYSAVRRPDQGADRLKYVRVTVFAAPYYVIIPPQRRGGEDVVTHQAWVPIDDDHNYFWSIRCNRLGPIRGGHQSSFQLDEHLHPKRNRANKHLQDRAAMKAGNWSGIDGVNSQDFAIVESMGPVYDRTREHLGLTDVAIIRFRRRMLDAARSFQAGGPPLGADPTVPYERVSSDERMVPLEMPWQQVAAFAGEEVPTSTDAAATRA